LTSTSISGIAFLAKSVLFLPIRSTATSVATLPGAFPFASMVCFCIGLYEFNNGHRACIRSPAGHLGDASVASGPLFILFCQFIGNLLGCARADLGLNSAPRSKSFLLARGNKLFDVRPQFLCLSFSGLDFTGKGE